mgnify:CR=1 FL=1
MIDGLSIFGVLETLREHGGNFIDDEVIHVDSSSVLRNEVRALLPVSVLQRLLGEWSQTPQQREEGDDTKHAHSAAE